MYREVNNPYSVNLYVGYCITKQEYAEIFNDDSWEEVQEDFKDCDGWVASHGRTILINFEEGFEFGTIIHECYHAANEIWIQIGAEHDRYNDEPFAYILGYIAEQAKDLLSDIFKK